MVSAAWTQVRLLPLIEGSFPVLEPQRYWGFQHHEIPDLSGKVAIVTGANVGLGQQTAKLLLKKGATVVMGCRRMDACEAARDELKGEVPDSGKAVPMNVDLASLTSVAAFADAFAARFDRLDAVVLNAAVFPTEFQTAAETQLEMAFSVNHLGHALLISRLLHHFEERMAASTGMKIAVVSSSHHFLSYDPPLWTAEAGAGSALANASLFSSNEAYGQSKLANVLFTQELADRLEQRGRTNFYVNAAHPGACVRHSYTCTRLRACFRACVCGGVCGERCAYACCSPRWWWWWWWWCGGGCCCCCCCPQPHRQQPGGVRTNLLAEWAKRLEKEWGIPTRFSEWLLDAVAGTFLHDAEHAALTPVYAVASPDVEVGWGVLCSARGGCGRAHHCVFSYGWLASVGYCGESSACVFLSWVG